MRTPGEAGSGGKGVCPPHQELADEVVMCGEADAPRSDPPAPASGLLEVDQPGVTTQGWDACGENTPERQPVLLTLTLVSRLACLYTDFS